MKAHSTLVSLLLAGILTTHALAQNTQPSSDRKPPAEAATAAAPNATNAAPAASGPAESPALPAIDKSAAGTNVDNQSKTNKAAGPEQIQVSFQGANIDMIVQWLAQTTGKSVVKHPQAQCQLTIMSSKKISTRDAINLVYRALSLEGFAAVETSDSILIMPEGKEPRMNPELLTDTRKDIPEGRQRLVKIFSLSHIQAAELREKVRGILSATGTIDTDERANQLVVTDYNDNLRLLSDLIREFDVSASTLVIEVRALKHADADELANMLGLILSAQAGGSAPGGASRPSRPSSSNPSPPPGVTIMSGGPTPSGGDSGPPPSSGGVQGSSGGQQVRLWPDKSSNRLVISAPKSKLPEVMRLIDILDTDKAEDFALRVIPLKNVNAADLAKELEPLYQKVGGRSPRETIQIAANDRSNSLIVLSSEANYKTVQNLVTALDTEEAQEKTTRTILLKNADAQDVAKQLQDLGKDQDSSSRYPYVIFSGYGSPNKGSKKLSVVADRRRNAIIVQAPPGQMEEIAKMIQELDEPVSDDSLAPKIYPLKFVSAVDIEDVLNELFLKKTQQRPYWYDYENGESQPDRDVGRLYGKVRITSEPYANAIIVTSNSKENLAVVEDVLKQLDRPSEAGESTLRIGLKYAKAFTVANSINVLFAKNGSPPLRGVNQQQPQQPQFPQQQQSRTTSQPAFELERSTKEDGYFPWLGGQPDNPRGTDGRNTPRPVSDLVGRVRAVPDDRCNAVLLSANVHFFPQILKLIEDLDAPTDQVLIEARLLEVASDFLDKLGVRWAPDGSAFTGDDLQNSILANTTTRYMQGFGGKSQVNTPQADQVFQTLTTLRSGVLNSTINVDFLIQFLKKTTDARVLAEPQINIRDNETGRLFVGQQIPIQTASQNSGSIGLTSNFEYKDVGVILEVTPHINNTGDVELKIHAESSVVVPGAQILNGAVFDTRNFRTDLTAKNGETLVLGGIIQKQQNKTLYKTPILGDIPVIKWLFNKKDNTSHEVELMVFLRPKVTRNPEDARELMNEINRKAPHVRQWMDELHPEETPNSTNPPPANASPESSR
jgi:type II secretion system protein D